MSTVLHPGLNARADSVAGDAAVPDDHVVRLASSPQDKTPAAGQERSHHQLQRLAIVRRQEGVSRRTIARRLGIGLREVQAQEQESADLPLSTLYRWREILDVPISELLEEDVGDLSPPIMFRAKLLQVMRMAVTIYQRTRSAATRRMAQFIAQRLIEIMPELKDTSPWPAVGKSCKRRELGRAARLRPPADLMRDLDMR
jgi:transcriptional regulator with XRE-family HTH domain